MSQNTINKGDACQAPVRLSPKPSRSIGFGDVGEVRRTAFREDHVTLTIDGQKKKKQREAGGGGAILYHIHHKLTELRPDKVQKSVSAELMICENNLMIL